MSQENVEFLRQGFAEFARGDLDALLERFDPDIDWHSAFAPSSVWKRFGAERP